MAYSGLSRTQLKIKNNLGVIPGDKSPLVLRWRCRWLRVLQHYMERTQYDDKMDWFDAERNNEFVPLRDRKPFIISPLPSVHVARINSKLFGIEAFPSFFIENDDTSSELLSIIIKTIFFQTNIKEIGKELLAYGSAFLSFRLENGSVVLEAYNPNHCYPVFDQYNDLESITIKFVFPDPEDLDKKTGKPIEKWYCKKLTKTQDILYDNPKYLTNAKPVFSPVDSVEHGLGFVQGQWFKLSTDPRVLDGDSLIQDILDLTDSLSYNLSQSDRASEYGNDPQTIFSGLTVDELESLVKSKDRAWALGREGSAQFLEISGTGLQNATEQDRRIRQAAQEITRAIFHDPEKITGSAQSAVAMKVLYAPLVDFILEVRPIVEHSMIKLITKIFLLFIKFNSQGVQLPIQMPANYNPKSIDISVKWKDVFPMTIQDFQQLSTVLTSLSNANIISRETVLEKLSQYPWLKIDDIQQEVSKVDNQKQFYSFFGG